MKRALALAFALAVGLSSGVAGAAEMYSKSAFMTAQEAGKSILVHVTAPWCPTCRAQKPIVAKLEHDMPGLAVFEVDFDTQKDALKTFNVTSQSTLIGFHGVTETGRSTGVTRPDKIAELAAGTKPMMGDGMMDKPMMEKPMMDKKM